MKKTLRSAILAVPGILALAIRLTAAEVPVLPPASLAHVDFVKDIQPMFAEHCLSCHGVSKHEAEFRLDAREIALKGGELGPAITPGKSAESLLIQAVAGLKPDLVMPRKGARLTSEQVGLLRAWIDQGADWPESASAKIDDPEHHWAFKVPERPALPAVKDKKWCRTQIDYFVLARLEKEKLKPSREADRRTLIRRLSLDLIGLPPTIKEVEEFAADKQPDAYSRLVERLLDSPHYGERWGRRWLDVARYADSNGYEKDKPRSIWPYRDWVIKALNEDMPYDQFAIEQLAGDLLPNATRDQRIATGFLRNSMLNQEGGIEPEQFRVESLIDRVDTVGKAFLGLTLNCCQCHNHKFDPFKQKEYFGVYAFLNNDDEAFMEVPTAEEEKHRGEILEKVRALKEHAMNSTTNLLEKMMGWETNISQVTTDWTVLEPQDWQNFATKFEKQDDGSLLGGGDLQPGGIMRVWAETQMTNITGFRLEALTNSNIMYNGPGLLGRGAFYIKEFAVEAYALTNATVTNQIKFRCAYADMEAPGFSITNAIDGNTTNGGWTPTLTPERRNQNHVAVFECEEPFGFPGGTRLSFTVHEQYDGDKDKKKPESSMLGCLRLSATTQSAPLSVETLSPSQRNLLKTDAAKRTPAQQLELFDAYRLADSSFTNLNREVDNSFTNWPYPATTLVLQRREHPRVTHLFKRGDRLRPQEVIEPAVPVSLHKLPSGAHGDRLGFARWVADPNSPTTARVIVNRLWQEYFGQGLVTTPEDFGMRVDAPSHPELLDWLACELMRPGEPDAKTNLRASGKLDSALPWSLKHIHRLIVNSATYRQSSSVTAEEYTKDQYNRLLERGPRFRVEGEVVQDIALSASGLLNTKIGGPSVYPPIPASVGDTVYGGFNWPESKGDERYRRGIYTFWKRSLPFPSLTVFDVPGGETACPRRVRSNTPLQALTTLNERVFVEAAQAMALRVMKEGGTNDAARAAYAFELCTGRKPATTEIKRLLEFWREQYSYFEDRTAAAVSVAVPDIKQIPENVNLHKVAAWAMVSRAILNLDETITKE